MRSAGLLAEAADNVAHDGSKVDLLEFQPKTARSDARHVHELVDESSQTLDLFERHFQLRFHLLPGKGSLRRSARWLEQHLDLQLQRRKWGAELVRRDGKKLVPRADCANRLAVEKLPLELRALPLGYVASD